MGRLITANLTHLTHLTHPKLTEPCFAGWVRWVSGWVRFSLTHPIKYMKQTCLALAGGLGGLVSNRCAYAHARAGEHRAEETNPTNPTNPPNPPNPPVNQLGIGLPDRPGLPWGGGVGGPISTACRVAVGEVALEIMAARNCALTGKAYLSPANETRFCKLFDPETGPSCQTFACYRPRNRRVLSLRPSVFHRLRPGRVQSRRLVAYDHGWEHSKKAARESTKWGEV